MTMNLAAVIVTPRSPCCVIISVNSKIPEVPVSAKNTSVQPLAKVVYDLLKSDRSQWRL